MALRSATRTRARHALSGHLRFGRHCVLPLLVVPVCILVAYASLIFIPLGVNSPGMLNQKAAGNTSVVTDSVVMSLCTGMSSHICSEGFTQILLLAVSRLSAYSLYVTLAMSVISKCYCTMLFLQSTVLSLHLPFRHVHDLHRLAGLAFAWASLIHTAAHLTRWALRQADSTKSISFEDSIGYHLTSPTGISGVFAIILLGISILPMWRAHFFSKTLKVSFERRHTLHLLVVPMMIVLCWHHLHVTVICGLLITYWAFDRIYLVLYKTIRVDDVAFTRLADGSVRIAWRNPSGQQVRPGQYVRIMVPMISKEFHPFSAFDYFPDRDVQALAGKALAGKALASNAPASSEDVMTHKSNSSPSPGAASFAASDHEFDFNIALSMVRRMRAEPSLSQDLEVGQMQPHAVATAETPNNPNMVSEKSSTPTMVEDQNHHSKGLSIYSQALIGPFGDWTRALSAHVQKCADKESWAGVCSDNKDSHLRYSCTGASSSSMLSVTASSVANYLFLSRTFTLPLDLALDAPALKTLL